jgi:hypothetical protein
MGKLRLFAPANVVARAGEVMGQIVEIYDLPNADFRSPADRPTQERVDILRAFGEACRDDLQHETIEPVSAVSAGCGVEETAHLGREAEVAETRGIVPWPPRQSLGRLP